MWLAAHYTSPISLPPRRKWDRDSLRNVRARPAVGPGCAGEELVRSPVWSAERARLERAQAKVGQVLAQDMRKMWADRAADKKKDTLKGEDKDLNELKQVENLKRRYDAIESALASAPQLRQVQGASAGRPGELLVEDPRTGQVYMPKEPCKEAFGGQKRHTDLGLPQRYMLFEYHMPAAVERERSPIQVVPANRLYEWHVPGAGTSAEVRLRANGHSVLSLARAFSLSLSLSFSLSLSLSLSFFLYARQLASSSCRAHREDLR